MLYLYVKTHNKTGLRYLGYTSADDPHKYTGSGIRWKAHLNKHGYDYTTEILHECQDKTELKELGLYYSKLWNVVESREWANLKEEQGDGGRQSAEVRERIGEAGKGRIPWNKGKKIWGPEDRRRLSEQNRARGPQSAETIAKRVAKITGRKHTEDARAKTSAALKGRTFSEESRRRMSESAKKRGFNGHGFEKGSVPMNAKEVQIENTITGEITSAPSLKQWCREQGVSYGAMWKAFKEGRVFKEYKKVDA